MQDTLTKDNNVVADTLTTTMKAAVITAPKKVEVQEAALPEPQAGQVRLQLQGCGLCASNIPVWEGREWFNYPVTAGNPGHEGWGVVDAIGEGVANVAVGDRVAALSYNAYAQYDLADADKVVKLPEALADKPFPGEPLGCAMNIFKRSEIKAGQTVAILGIGFLGALLVQLAKNAGARVIAISQREFSLEVAKECGADEIIAMDDHYKIIEKVKELTNGNFCERVIECTGKEWPLNLAGELSAERGRLIIAGFHQDGMRQVNVQLWNWRGLDVINAHERDPQMYIEGIKAAVSAVEEGVINPDKLYTHTYTLDNIDNAFDNLTNRPDGFVKALITY
ncbi:MDR/zinc-dependent alcohol dehydrogenase-like family protein [Pontibacter akesuensis]|uniref:D-arabinose 1-dehydrogenase, Zn-dependent alcohol dehydrogenase family n=1 Tax=Pontibacter akesuensis TaxID=388950 RepID=A0A1I7H3J0_9BACT|nr:zinc-binding dehydrogenase [Pontibacter akesuensis]GHA53639.1 alcohol dehydrogenase [Pontibacter akesuensis]SFU55264.1 D-arabinose 1-dehydrogenase, Zn-dependent alcohol dehydrogenase family [Pontibacter akesuensis]